MPTNTVLKPFSLEKEYAKPTGITPQDISKLREWLHTQPHLPGEHITELDLILFYHCCERSTEVSKQLIDLHYTLRTLFTNFFNDRVVEGSIERTLNRIALTPLPTRTKEGYAVLYSHFLDCDPQNFHLADNLKAMMMLLDLWQYEEGTWPGFVLIVNFEGAVWGHMARLDLSNMRHFIYYLQEAMLLKLKGIHILNAPAFIDKLLSMLKPFLKNQLLEVVHIHQAGSKALEDFYPAEALPKEAGGRYKSLHEAKDLDLILAYHCCGRSAEVSKQLLDKHYTVRTAFCCFFQDRKIDERIQTVFSKFLMKPLPTRTAEGCAVLYTQYIDSDPQNFVLGDVIRAMLMVIDLWQYEEGTWPGFVMVCNLEAMTVGHMTKFDLTVLRQFAYYLQEALLLNLKAVHIMNAPSFIDTLLGIAKPFIRNTLLDIVHVHQVGARSLERFYPIAALPKEAGGGYKTVEECKDEILAKLEASTEYFKAENKKRVVESRRPGRPKTITDIFDSVEGSFKQLEID